MVSLFGSCERSVENQGRGASRSHDEGGLGLARSSGRHPLLVVVGFDYGTIVLLVSIVLSQGM